MISSSACVGGLASQELLCASYVHGVHLTWRAEDLTWREIVTLDWPCTPRKTIGAEWVWVTSHHVAIYATPTAFLLCKGMHRILGRGWPDAVAVKEPHHLRSRQSEVRLCYGRTRTDLVGEQ